MDIEVETRNIINTIVKWDVSILSTSSTVESKPFVVYDYDWKLELATTCRSYDLFTRVEQWSMKLYCTDNKEVGWFPLSVNLRHKGRYLCLNKIVIRSRSAEIWNSTRPDFRKKYPAVDGSILHFEIQFHTGIKNPGTLIKVEKSVQTSDPNPENHPCLEKLSLDLSKLVDGGFDTDVQLKCGDASVGVHKLILGVRSEVFRTMMQSDMVEGREGIVEIKDMEPELLNIFIRYIYTGNLPDLTVDTALPIYEAADKYQVEALKKRSSQFLVKNLSPENALGILVTADAHSDSELKDQLVHYIVKKKMPSRKVEWLKFCNEYPELAVEVLNFFYDLPTLSQ